MQFDFQKYLDGQVFDAYNYLGYSFDGTHSYFRVYAPHAKQVAIMGSFNNWTHDDLYLIHPGFYEAKFKGELANHSYKYKILTENGWIEKADPYAFYSERRPHTASRTYQHQYFEWDDQDYYQKKQGLDQPINVFELHLGSWRSDLKSYVDISYELLDYLKKHHFTHVEVMPISEHPFDGSWGYQVSGFYAVTSRFGQVADFKHFVNLMHKNGIGVILDWVPVHFVKDMHGLIDFDGEALYEYPFDDLKEIPIWGTRNFDFGKGMVHSFLISNAMYFYEYFHIDGLRVDAVNNIIYYLGDVSRGINENGIEFLKKLNHVIKSYKSDALMIAEDSSIYPGVTEVNGLNFDLKWNFGWMHDTLDFFSTPFDKRSENNYKITFASSYRKHEKYILMLSHDEVVHGKKSIINKMYGTYEEKFAQIRCLMLFMLSFPGKKGNFMGNELATFDEFDEKSSIAYHLLDYPAHDSYNQFFINANQMYLKYPQLYDDTIDNFEWILVNESDNMLVYRRDNLVCIFNLSNQDYKSYSLNISANMTTINQTSDKIHYWNENNKLLIDIAGLNAIILEEKNE